MLEILFPLIILIIVTSAVIISVTYNKKDNSNYDEFQILNRLKAYKISFFFLMFYNILIVFLSEIFNINLFVNKLTEISIGIILSLSVFAIMSILKDSYLAITENKKRKTVLTYLIGISNLSLGIYSIMTKTFLENGLLTYNCVYFLLGILFIILGILISFKKDSQED